MTGCRFHSGRGYHEPSTQTSLCPLYCNNARKHGLVWGNSQGQSLDVRQLLCYAGQADVRLKINMLVCMGFYDFALHSGLHFKREFLKMFLRKQAQVNGKNKIYHGFLSIWQNVPFADTHFFERAIAFFFFLPEDFKTRFKKAKACWNAVQATAERWEHPKPQDQPVLPSAGRIKY